MTIARADGVAIKEALPSKLLLTLANPPIKLLLAPPLRGLADDRHILLSWRDRKSDCRYRPLGGYHRVDKKLTAYTFSG